jgi:hypothetical protein
MLARADLGDPRPSPAISSLSLREIEQGEKHGQTHDSKREQQTHDGTSWERASLNRQPRQSIRPVQ